jgi:transposase
LVFSRILNPDSKLETFKGKDGFFADPFKEIKLDNVYDALTELHENETKLQLHIHEQVSKLYNRNLKMVFYDVTNYFFDTDYDDGYDEDGKPLGLRYVGVSKEKRETPIVQMGLLMDEQRIPIAYKLFEGNTHDQRTLVPILEEFKKTFNLKSITIIADKGLNSGSNIDYLLKNNHKFIVSQMVRTRDEKFRSLVLENEGYK